ncbi:hypothetical protein KBB27_02430 [Patescibacteria group bacterium]|nr:hypothetical protein [Patescibacteria group bacterium]
MIAVLVGALAFFLAALWETHVAVFLPVSASLFPLWGVVVVGLCLESDLLKLGTGLVFALTWEELLRPVGILPISWIWLPLMFGAFWLLRVWLSHRSLLSALVLTLFGRCVWVLFRAWEVARVTTEQPVWGKEGLLWLSMLIWDVVFVTVVFLLMNTITKRLSPYMPSFSHRSRL